LRFRLRGRNKRTGGGAMKKKIMTGLSVVLMLLLVLASIILYLYVFDNTGKVKAQAKAGKEISRDMLRELQKEQQFLTEERKRLQEYERNLKVFEADLEQRYNEYLLKAKKLAERERVFNEQVLSRMVNRQTIETYENIDPEQAAVLMKNLYAKDKELAVIIMRKISGKRAGKILEAMIPLDSEISTQLAKESLEYYKPD
jgi:flagellar motility protein MotE (MotC chaperone)